MDVYAIDLSNQAVNPLAKIGTIASLVNVFIPILIGAAALLLLMLLLYGSFYWITSGGNPENVAKAQKIMTYAIFGIILVVLSFLFVRILSSVLRISAPI